MSTFEKWAIDYGLDYEPSFTRDDVEAAWQAATAERDKLITELQAQNSELSASLNVLRENLDYAYYEVNTHFAKNIKDLLASTPAQSLIQHDNEVIEKCAKVCEESYAFDSDGFAKEIRALKHTS